MVFNFQPLLFVIHGIHQTIELFLLIYLKKSVQCTIIGTRQIHCIIIYIQYVNKSEKLSNFEFPLNNDENSTRGF